MLGHFTLPPIPPGSSVGTLRTVPRHPAQVLGHFVLSQDYLLKCCNTSHCPMTSLFKCWDASHCPKTSRSSVETLNTVPRPPCSSVGTLRAVPRHPAQVLGSFTLSQDLPRKLQDTSHCPKTFVQLLGHLVLSQDYLLKCWDSRISSSLGQSDLLLFGVWTAGSLVL